MSKLKFKEGQTYVCKRDDIPWWTLGKEYKIVFDKCHGLIIVDDCGDEWYLPNDNLMKNVFKPKETSQKVTMKDLQAKAVEHKYTLFEVNKVILRTYQLYDNDSQRLAYIKGYFAK